MHNYDRDKYELQVVSIKKSHEGMKVFFSANNGEKQVAFNCSQWLQLNEEEIEAMTGKTVIASISSSGGLVKDLQLE